MLQEAAAVPGVEVHEVSCLGRCDLAPAGAVNEIPVPLSDPGLLRGWIEAPDTVSEPPPPTNRVWRADPYPTPGERYGLLRALLGEDRQAAGLRLKNRHTETFVL